MFGLSNGDEGFSNRCRAHADVPTPEIFVMVAALAGLYIRNVPYILKWRHEGGCCTNE
jgi:hypothetical protein